MISIKVEKDRFKNAADCLNFIYSSRYILFLSFCLRLSSLLLWYLWYASSISYIWLILLYVLLELRSLSSYWIPCLSKWIDLIDIFESRLTAVVERFCRWVVVTENPWITKGDDFNDLVWCDTFWSLTYLVSWRRRLIVTSRGATTIYDILNGISKHI